LSPEQVPTVRKTPKLRLDEALTMQGLTLERARAEILGGNVLVDEQPCDRASHRVGPDQAIRLKSVPMPFVSRAGGKLDAALREFGVDVAGRTAADLGASTGGFTDCLLQRGARRVYAIDVGYNQLAWKLRQDPRVVVMERTNARTMAALPEPVTLVVGDLSFISLGQILPTVARLLAGVAGSKSEHPASHEAVLLIKPQFEAERGAVARGGHLPDGAARDAAIEGVLAEARQLGFEVVGVAQSTVPGAKAKNVEALVHLRVGGMTAP
jgi:23S rRNA (cytidine1920-2'-O)/16S rRNA (cytidine1409-2'-O)-methyltransferase